MTFRWLELGKDRMQSEVELVQPRRGEGRPGRGREEGSPRTRRRRGSEDDKLEAENEGPEYKEGGS